MSNPYYTYSGAFIPGTLARAEAEGTEFTAVQQGFAILAIQGTDSGAANAYVVTTKGGQDGSYADGMIVEFKAANANTGASTINVDGGGVVGLTQATGASLAAGAISANTWCRAIYNTTYSAFTLIAPILLSTTSNTISSAAPTNKVGLTAAGGVSTACVPIDATYAIDQSIAPTWTGAHVFSAGVTFNSTVTFSGGLSLTGIANHYAATLTGSSTTGQSLGLEVNAGTNSSDVAFLVNSQSGATAFFEINGQGSVTVGSPTGGAKGVGTINAQALYVQGAAVVTSNVTSANPSASVGLAAVNGSAATFMTSDSAPALSQAIVPTWTAAHTWTPPSAVVPITINAFANGLGLVINGGTNTGLHYLVEFITGQGSGFSSGLYIQAGTTSGDLALQVSNAAGAHSYLSLFGDGSGNIGFNGTADVLIWDAHGHLTFSAPTAGGQSGVTLNGRNGNYALNIVQGSGSGSAYGVNIQAGTTTADSALNVVDQTGATGLFQVKILGGTAPQVLGGGPIAGALVDMTPDSGSWVGTFAGVGGLVTSVGTAYWSRNGNQVTAVIPTCNPSGTATSISTTFRFNGIPPSLLPTRTQTQSAYGGNFIDNGAGLNLDSVGVVINSANGTATFLGPIGGGAWTGSGAKSITSAFNVSWILN